MSSAARQSLSNELQLYSEIGNQTFEDASALHLLAASLVNLDGDFRQVSFRWRSTRTEDDPQVSEVRRFRPCGQRVDSKRS